MAEPKRRAIPEWQHQGDNAAASKDSPSPVESAPEPHEGSAPSSRADLLEQARAFLDREEIRDATTDSKISFLAGKGLTNGEIQQLLGISCNEEAVGAPDIPSSETPSSETLSSNSAPLEKQQNASSTSPSGTQAPTPIITYPEFLLYANRPPPLITTSRILSTLYASSFLAATLYGTSTYVLQPMLASLTGARRSLFGTAITNLSTLNSKLESVVSSIPPAAHALHLQKPGAELGDTESTFSDPAELFHRDVAVQTSAPPSPSPSSSVSGSYLDTHSHPASHASRLQSINSHLSTILSSSTSTLDADEEARARIRELHSYLEDLSYGKGGRGYNGLTWDGRFGAAGGKQETDEIAKLKAEIRSVKGVLLSARNFPAGARGGRGSG